MSAVARKPAPRPAKPVARYWRGKAPKGVAELTESEDEEEIGKVEEDGGDEDVDIPLGAIEGDQEEADEDDEQENGLRVKAKTMQGKMNIALRDVDIKDGKVIVAGRDESGKTALEESEEDSEEEDEETKPSGAQAGAEAEEESSEYESSSEEEEPPKPMFRPVFVPKRGRVTVLEREKEAHDSEEALERKRLEEEERRKQSHDLVAESIKRELAEKEREKEIPDLDDTDGLDPDAEFEAWRLRELSRIKRDKEAQAAREIEREEIERRRALPEAQRLQEDLERAKASREAKSKGQQQFLQKYWHKGAFHQDDEVLKKHDYTAATESTIDVSLLPKVMQVRDFGKRSRTKYTHLVDQDTTVGTGGFGGVALKPGMTTGGKSGDFSAGCFTCGGPHLKKDCPNNTGPPGTGANNASGSYPNRSWGQNGGRDRDTRLWNDKDRRDADRSPPRYWDGNERDRYSHRREGDFRNGKREGESDRSKGSEYRDRGSYDRKYTRRSRSRSPPRKHDYRDKPRDRSRERSMDEGRHGKRIRTD